jgi:hypothetical protein
MTRHSATLTQSLLAVAFAAGLLDAVPHVSAQQTAIVTVPFAFSVNHHMLPAGSYKVDLSSPNYVTLIDRNTAKGVGTFLARREPGSAIETRSRLTFRRIGSRAALTQVWIAGSSMHGELAVQPKVERELEAAKSAPTSSLIEIALK